jgi:hypothetical protein
MEQIKKLKSPLAKTLPVSELDGRLNKYLDVPHDRLGLSYSASGEIKYFSSGRHKVSSFSERILNSDQDVIYGIVPTEQFSVQLEAPLLTSRDGGLVDLHMICRVKINTPEKFFAQEVLPQENIYDEPLMMDEVETRDALNPFVSQHDWIDLVHGYSIDRLIELMFPFLPKFLESHGMELVSVDIIGFQRSEQQESHNHKNWSLNDQIETLDSVKENQSEDNIFDKIKNKLPDGFRIKDPGNKDLLEQINNIDPDLKLQNQSKRRGLLGRLLGQKNPEEAIPHKRLPRFWWFGRTLWILSLLSIGALLTVVALKLRENIDGFDLWNFILFGVWGVNLPLVFNSVTKLIEKREKLSEERWMAPGSVYLDDLVRNNRQKADQVVRQHCSEELSKTVKVLHDIRSRAFKQNKTEEALCLRNLERKIDDASRDLNSEQFGKAPYLKELYIPNQAWHRMLDYDEYLMLYSNALCDISGKIQADYVDHGINTNTLDELERQVDLFITKFAARSRALKS